MYIIQDWTFKNLVYLIYSMQNYIKVYFGMKVTASLASKIINSPKEISGNLRCSDTV